MTDPSSTDTDTDTYARPQWAPAEQGTMPLPPPPGRQAPQPRRSRLWPAMLVAAVVAALTSAAITVPLTRDDATGAPGEPRTVRIEGDQAPVAAVAEAVLPTVANVDTGGGAGSAVIFRADGYLLTNHHVVREAQQLEVTLPDGTTHAAELVGSDPLNDVAVLRIEARDLPVPAFAEELPEVGETAVAIGAPFGLEGSVTAGVVSALGRSLQTGDGGALIDLIQTDAPINPGNSGGALVNGSAEVIGINTIIIGAGGSGNIGIGFAVPITTALPIAEQLVETGEVRHARLGVLGQSVDPSVAEAYGLDVREGAVIVEVQPGSPAEAAGLSRGDIIVAVEGEPVGSMPELAGRIRRHQPGDEVTVTIVRDGDRRDVQVTLAELTADPGGG